MKLVCRNTEQLETIVLRRLREMLHQYPDRGILIDVEEHKPPRTGRQNRKFHAMCRDLGQFTGEDDMKGAIKSTDIWPKVKVWKTRVNGDKLERVQEWVPKSESKLTKAEESEIIDLIYALAASLPGFEWSHE